MLENLKKAIALLKYLDLHPNVAQFEWRFKIQKFTRIAEALGFPVTYSFSIYLKGPYSCELTREYFDHQEAVRNLDTDYILSPDEEQMVRPLKKYVNIELQELEALATLVHLKQEKTQLSDDELFVRVKALKPYLSDSTIVIARNEMKTLFFKSSFLTPAIQEEIDNWDRLDD